MQSETREMDAFDVQLSEIEVKSLDNGDLQVEGYASTFHDRDRHNDTIDPAAFDETMPRFMEKPVMLAFHQPKLPMGFFPEATLDSKGLYVKGNVGNQYLR